MRYNRGTGQLENWLIEEDSFDSERLGKCEAIFCQGNGYLGVRNALTEPYLSETRGTFVTGTFDCFHENEVTELPNFPDVTRIIIEIDGIPYSLLKGKVLTYSRIMNLKNGETIRSVLWESPDKKQIRFCFKRMVSMEDTHVITELVEMESIVCDADVQIISGIDGTMTNTGSQHFQEGNKRIYDNRYLEMISTSVQSNVTASIHTGHKFFVNEQEVEPEILPVIKRRMLEIKTAFQLKKGEVLTVEKMTVIHTSRDLEYSEQESAEWESRLSHIGKKHIQEVREEGYDRLLEKSTRVWEDLWEQEDIKISSDSPFDQLAIRFAIYHLNIMVKKDDNRVGIGAKALSGEGYKGHSFWDTEVFILPYYMMTQPETARTLLEYRYKNLYGARKKAKENGYEGAMYPWESAWIDDGETTPLWGAADVVTGENLKIWTGIIEQHISADIAFAVWKYYQVTGDEAFMEQYGYEMIFETAKFWASRLEWNEDTQRFELNDVIGPDEYKEHVNNNAYTNYMAHFNLKLADSLIRVCREEKKEVYKRLNEIIELDALEKKIKDVVHLIYLPQPDEKNGLIPQFDGFFDLKELDITKYKASSVVGIIYEDYNMEQINSFQVLKQADIVLLLQLLGDSFDADIRNKNYTYYEARTLHDSSLSRATHCVSACEMGLEEDAYTLYQGACKTDLGQEMKSSDAGIHSACMGGIWQSVVMGFGGICIRNDRLELKPALPKAWSSLEYRICYKGANLKIHITPEKVSVTNKGKDIDVWILGQRTYVKGGE